MTAEDSCIAPSWRITVLVLSFSEAFAVRGCVEQQSKKTSSSLTAINRIDVCNQDVWLYPAELERDHSASLSWTEVLMELFFPTIFSLPVPRHYHWMLCNTRMGWRRVLLAQKLRYEMPSSSGQQYFLLELSWCNWSFQWNYDSINIPKYTELLKQEVWKWCIQLKQM